MSFALIVIRRGGHWSSNSQCVFIGCFYDSREFRFQLEKRIGNRYSLHSDLAISTGLVDSLAHSAPPVDDQRIFPSDLFLGIRDDHHRQSVNFRNNDECHCCVGILSSNCFFILKVLSFVACTLNLCFCMMSEFGLLILPVNIALYLY